MVNSRIEYERMEAAEKSMWWYRVLHEKVIKVLVSQKINQDTLVIDLGCGTGGLMTMLVDKGYAAVEGIDISDDAIFFCKDKKLNVRKADLLTFKVDDNARKPGVIIANDSLYFFENLELNSIVKNIHASLLDNGMFIMNYPTLNAFKGMHDRSVGIIKRKSKKELEQILSNAGFEIFHSEYWPFLLSPVLFIIRQTQQLKLILFKNTVIHSDVSMPNGILNQFLYYISKFEEKINYRPWGSSVFIIAKK